MHAPKLPDTPDPAVVSQAQTQSNEDTAAYNNAITHGNTTTPYGSQTYTSRVDPVTGATVYDQNVSVDPAVQATINAQNNQDLALANTGTGMLGSINDAYKNPMDTSGLPAPVNSLDLSSLPKLYGADDLLGARQQVQDALYSQQSRYLDPQYANKDQALRTEIANKGVAEGSEAWRNMMDQFSRDKALDYGSARDSAIAGGGDEMSRLAGIALGNRGEAYNETLGAGNFANNASKDALTRAIALRNQPLNEFSALRSGTQVSVPQFQNAATPMSAPTDTAGNTWKAYDANSQAAQLKANASNSLLSGLFGLGSSFLANPATKLFG